MEFQQKSCSRSSIRILNSLRIFLSHTTLKPQHLKPDFEPYVIKIGATDYYVDKATNCLSLLCYAMNNGAKTCNFMILKLSEVAVDLQFFMQNLNIKFKV